MPASDRAYWEARLRQRFTLGSVGWIGLGESYNRWLYRVRRNVFTRTVSPLLSPTARVVDVGSGTGFYVDLWRRLGVASIAGSDMTEVAVSRLSERFAPIDFHRYELGAGDVPAFGEVDVVSAMDVLFHIVDDEQYRRALDELGSILRPGGHLVLTENVASDEEQRARRQVSRTRQAITAALRDAGLTPVACRPMFVLMNTPVGGRSRLAERWWRMVHTIVTRGERAGVVAGALLYPAELVATRLRRTGPSTQILVCRKEGAPPAPARGPSGMRANPRFEQPQLWGHLAHDPNIQHRAAMLEEMIPGDVASILDVGCGDGGITNRLAARWDVTGVDQSTAALEHLRTTAVRASALDLPFADASFDLVLSSEMLEHLPLDEYRQATRELRRVARRYVLVSVPYREDLRFRTIRCPQCGWRGHVWGHRQVFTVESLIGDLDGFGARQVRVFGARQDPVWPRWLLWITHNVVRQFYWAPGQSPMCARCGNTEFTSTRAIHPALRRLNGRLPGRTRVRLPFCLAVLSERMSPGEV